MYVVGTTSSADMLSTVLTGTGYGGGKDAFVVSLNSFYVAPLYYAAYLGGGGDDKGAASPWTASPMLTSWATRRPRIFR